MKKTKLVIPALASLLLATAPAWADSDSKTTVEEHTEERTDDPRIGIGDTRHSEHTVETKRSGDDSKTTVRHEEKVQSDALGTKRTVEKRTEEHQEED